MTIDKAFFAIILNLITHYMVGVAAKTANTIKYNDKNNISLAFRYKPWLFQIVLHLV